VGRASRQKGKTGERQVVRRFIAKGIPCRRAWESQSLPGGQTNGDLEIGEGTPLKIYAEVRRRETLSIPAWLREIEERAPEGHQRALIFRRSREDWHVALPLDEYLDLLKRASG
jgi:hypothetical protein